MAWGLDSIFWAEGSFLGVSLSSWDESSWWVGALEGTMVTMEGNVAGVGVADGVGGDAEDVAAVGAG